MTKDQDKVTIAPFNAADHDQLIAMITTIQQVEFAIPVTYSDQPDLHDIPAFYRHGAGEFWVARVAGNVVGTVALMDMGAGQGALRKMFVNRQWRGLAGGNVGGALLQTLLGHAANHALNELFLGTTTQFVAAHRFYRKNGFEEIAADQLPPTFPRMAVDTMFFQRRATNR